MGLNALTVVFGLDEVWVGKGLEVVDVFLACEHRPDRIEKGYLVVEGN